jgi:hypothetical protein
MSMRAVVVSFVLGFGCSSSPSGLAVDAPSGGVDADTHVPGNPGIGAHGLSHSELGVGAHPMPIQTPALSTRSGSAIIVSVGRGDKRLFALPTDTKGNAPYQQLDTVHTYTPYPDSGTALYAFLGAAGGDGFRVNAATDDRDEITIAAVEVLEGTRIADHAWVNAPSASTVKSASVTTTGPATLIAFWWGDANQYFVKTAVPNNGFTVIDSLLAEGSLVQCAVAVKTVTSAGTYDVSWTATPVQGAQLWLVAVD